MGQTVYQPHVVVGMRDQSVIVVTATPAGRNGRPPGVPERRPGDHRKNCRVTPWGTELCDTWWCVEKSFDRVIISPWSGFPHLRVGEDVKL